MTGLCPMVRRPLRRAGGLLLCLGALAGCAGTDTYRRPGTWHPDGANAANIAAMAANPGDLLRGRGSPGSDGPLAARAIDRLWDVPQPGTGGASAGGPSAGAQPTGGPSGFATPLSASGPSGSP